MQFVTAAPDPAREFTVVTNLCIFRLKNGKLELDSIFPYTTLEEVKEKTGWEIIQKTSRCIRLLHLLNSLPWKSRPQPHPLY